MPIPPPPPPGGPPPPPTFSQANTTPPKLNRDEAKGRGALLGDIHKGAKLKKVGVVHDRSAPILEKPKGDGAGVSNVGGGGSSGVIQPMGGLFQAGVPKLRPVGDGSVGRSPLTPPGTRPAAPRPPGPPVRQDNTDCSAQQASPPEHSRSQRPSLPDLSRPLSGGSPNSGMKHSSSAPPPPPPFSRRGNAPPAPTQKAPPPAPSYNREKPLPPTPVQRGTSPVPARNSAPPPPPSPNNNRRPLTSGGSSASSSSSSLGPPPPPYRQPMTNGPSSPVNEAAPELPQRHNSLSKKPSPGPGHTPTRGQAPPPPPPSPSPPGGRPPPPVRDPPGRGAAPPPPGPSQRNGGRDAPPPPPPYRGSPSEPHSRGKPPPPPSRTPAAPPPPPPPIRNGHTSISRSFVDDFESKYSFHPLDDFPVPEEYRHFTKIYPSKANRVMRGAPPAPPVGR
ncbi:LOW QUALITY PROTEIN: WAS/WASL-interacting protein family member 2 [Salmo salar]|uniref:LOW QUALITY PROTEIN: WAS/WASL-interacting protein family member 2 n=1 Tax=Salmo salar TaxID=8030 RepID=A0A1S3S6K5_SALSA|nr:LOW QUALITY PROTEIN: WAS/WASL-interacting protein family member 2 [Salmo salar]|eukprot:XP_014059977.1 PREDICTED: WAS/WASL-interacting protein family member 2-like [Salmo salar]